MREVIPNGCPTSRDDRTKVLVTLAPRVQNDHRRHDPSPTAAFGGNRRRTGRTAGRGGAPGPRASDRQPAQAGNLRQRSLMDGNPSLRRGIGQRVHRRSMRPFHGYRRNRVHTSVSAHERSASARYGLKPSDRKGATLLRIARNEKKGKDGWVSH